MNVICAGMKRSGSTWLFNAVRLLLETDGETFSCFEDEVKCKPAKHRVVKAHKFNAFAAVMADIVFTCHRDPHDVAASAVRRHLITGGPIHCIRYLDKCIFKEYDKWQNFALQLACYRYESIITDPVDVIMCINNNLFPDRHGKPYNEAIDRAHCTIINDTLIKLTVPMHTDVSDFDRDPVTLLHPDHFTDGAVGNYHKTLLPESITAIEKTFGRWMRQHGYLAE